MSEEHLHLDLEIDKQPQLVSSANVLFQKELFPANHNFHLVISGKGTAKKFSFLPAGKHKVETEELARNCMQILGFLFQSEYFYVQSKPKYLLNTVNEFYFDGERIQFKGICSPVT
jgi:hypothetical protein